MSTVEFFTRGLDTERKLTAPAKGYPVEWCVASQLEYALAEQEKSVLPTVDKPLVRGDLLTLGPLLFDGSDALETTVAALTGGGDVQRLRGWQVNFGRKALILMYEATVDNSPCYFVTYLSRGTLGTDLAREAVQDFHDLCFLSTRFQDRLSSETQGKYAVVEPITFGISGEYQGGRFPFFTMPVVEDQGELRVNFFPYQMRGEPVALPWFGYAYRLDSKQKYVDDIQQRKAEKLVRWITRNSPRYGRNLDGLFTAAERTEYGQWFLRQSEELLVGNALVFMLSGNRFPREFYINAGDWMAAFQKGGGFSKLTLITVAGGFVDLRDEDGWVARMRGHREPYYRSPVDIQAKMLPIFQGMSDRDYAAVLEKARLLIVG